MEQIILPNEDFILPDAGFDQPDERDFPHEEVFEFGGFSVEKEGNQKRNRRTLVQNQNAQVETHYACSIYGLTHVYNELNAIESESLGVTRPEKDALYVTREVVSANVWFQPKRGWYMQNALKYFKDNGMIDGYTLVKKVGETNGDTIARAIDSWFILYTGSSSIDWKATIMSGKPYAIKWRSYGHIFAIVDYFIQNGKRFFTIRQSVGPKYFDEGYVYLPEDQLVNLFSVYAIIDKDESQEILAYKAKRSGIWNGYNGNAKCSRLEAATMIQRASLLADKDIWNGERANDPVSESELSTMQTRAFGKTDTSAITRKQLAVFCERNKKASS